MEEKNCNKGACSSLVRKKNLFWIPFLFFHNWQINWVLLYKWTINQEERFYGALIRKWQSLIALTNPLSCYTCYKSFAKTRFIKFVSLITDCGFEIPDKFVVGYALDYNEYFRDLGVSIFSLIFPLPLIDYVTNAQVTDKSSVCNL